MFRITKLIVQKYGPFEKEIFHFNENDAEELAEVHMITGENGTGKSSLLYALTLPENQAPVQMRLHDQKDGNSKIEIHYSIGNPTIVSCIKGKLHWESVNEQVQNEYLNFSHDAFLHHEFSFAMFSYSSYRNIGLQKIIGTKEIAESPVRNALNFQVENSMQLLQWIANMKSREANAHYKNEIQKRDLTKASTERIENAIGAIIGKSFKFIYSDDPIAVNVMVDAQVSSFDVLPDGLKSILSWIGDMLMRLDRMPWKNNIPIGSRNLILFLDEIDVHLHPKWQRQVLYIVQKLFPNAQIFVSTHSPFVASSIGDAFIHELKKVETNSKLFETVSTDLGSSYNRMINEVFSITSEFSPPIDSKLQDFYALKSKVLRGDQSQIETLSNLASELSEISDEVQALISFEMRQLKKIVS